ncbi:MAG: nucleotidyltransferase family protein [Planctomycetes bacterium]|nr:nucleotidyltransferase family protein [Planctomycetota bacterium]
MAANSKTALVILTAGKSTRMGEPKALLRFGKHTALELAVHNAIEAGIQRAVAVVGHRAEEIRAAHSFTGLPLTFQWALNLNIGSPQIVSLQAGLKELQKLSLDAFLFQPVDFPLVTAADLQLLIQAFQRRSSGSERIFIPSYENRRGHPVLCDARLIEAFLKLPPDRSARDLFEQHQITYVETGNPGVLEDMDTREDYLRLREIYLSWKRASDQKGSSRIHPSDPKKAPAPIPLPAPLHRPEGRGGPEERQAMDQLKI